MAGRPVISLRRGVLIEHLRDVVRTLQRERVFALALFVTLVVLLGALGFYIAEPLAEPNGPAVPEGAASRLEHLGQALWWAVVTITTVGYGDITPKTLGGRLVGIGLMVGGVLTLSLVTATVASIFVERKFRRERGLETIKAVNHILILGWHYDGENLLTQLLRRLPPTTRVVLVNELPPEKMDSLRLKYPANEPLFVRGDHSREEILQKANVRHAFKAVILAGRHESETAGQVDQRTLLTALTLKSLNPKIKVMAELLRPENQPYLERAGAEQILIRGQYDSSLLAGAIASPGLFQIMDALLNAYGYTVWSVDVPPTFQGRPVRDLAAYLNSQHQALLIALYTEGRALSLEDLLGEESSPIDDFIRRKFSETGMTHLFGRSKVEFQINPPETQVIVPHQKAVVIAAQQPEL
uniref:Potassium channel protein n=1 Tax=Desulfobacca acetoxidans TaxID=60893 RepID=A0A7V4G7W8_9BACT